MSKILTDADLFLRLPPKDLLAPMGQIIAQWGWTETLMDSAIWKLLGVRHKRGRAVTTHLSAWGKIQMIQTLMNLTKRDKTKLKKLEKEGKKLAELRNLIAHGYIANPFLSTEEPRPVATIIMYAAKGKLTNRSRLISPKELERLARRIAEFNAFLSEFHDELPPLPGTPKTQGLPKPRKRPLRLETILKRLPPPLEA